jgi:hypothetical protein
MASLVGHYDVPCHSHLSGHHAIDARSHDGSTAVRITGMTKRQALKAIVAAVIPWHLDWTRPPKVPGPYTIILDDVSELVLAKNGEHVSVPVNELFRALKS